MPVVTVEVRSLGNRCHLVHDGRVGIVVDPPRDLDAVETAVRDAEVDVAAVAETHVHNDYLSGGLALARRHGADLLLSADERVDFERVGVRDGDRLEYGALAVEVLDTPGHTRHHQSFLVSAPDEPSALFSGGSLLLGTVGRTDLVDPRCADVLAAEQWSSAHRQGALDPGTRLHPTHGFGSFCAATTAGATDDDTPATVGAETTTNPALTTPRDNFVRELVAGFGPIPAYYPRMDPLNRRGAGAAPTRPPRPLDYAGVELARHRGAWLVDLRDRARFAEGHLPGAIGIEYSDQFATYVGWLVPEERELVLLTEDPARRDLALRDLARIGIEAPAVHRLDRSADLVASYRRTNWTEYGRAVTERARPVVVDVRQRDEWALGHLDGAVHVPIQDVDRSAAALPDGELWVHCRSGYRAGIAAGLLHRRGRTVVHVDDTWDRAVDLHLPITVSAA